MKIRQAISTDCVALAGLMTELGYPTSTDEMAARMQIIADRVDHATFVADANGAIAGMIGLQISPSLYKNDPEAAIVALVVSSAFRGQGVAGLLVERGERWLFTSGAIRVSVKPSLHREDAHRLYKRLGYEHTGARFTKTLSHDTATPA